MNSPLLPPPYLLGAPAQYTKWRTMQSEAVLAAADSKHRFVVQGAPTAFGKSLAYTTLALLTDARTVILTSTKALMDQVHGDMEPAGMIQIRGLNSYECVEGRPGGRFGDMKREGYRADRGLPMMCDEAPCHAGVYCPSKDGGCLYYDAYRRAGNLNSKLIVTNYAYWMSINRFGEGMGKVDLLVLDEAHNATDELGGFMGTELRPPEVESVLPSQAKLLEPGADQGDWAAWGGYWKAKATAALEEVRAAIRESDRTGDMRTGGGWGGSHYGAARRAAELRRLVHKLDTVAGMRGEWIIDWGTDGGGRPVVKFDPVWPGDYAESRLFLGVPKVVMVSATVRPETATKLGVRRDLVDFREYPSPIPKGNRPTIYIPTVHMNRRSGGGEGGGVPREMSMRVDQVLDRRPAVKGIVHTVSYSRARALYLASRHRQRMLVHDSTNTREIIAQFKRSTQPLVIVSPVLDTGYDFPYDQARFQIVIKMPFPVTVDKVVKARTALDKGYRDYVTMVKLVQMAGRIVRAPDDWGETLILDSDFGWWYYGAGRKLCPRWFTESVVEWQLLGAAMAPPPLIGSPIGY